MKILLLGGSGQVGGELQRALAPLGELTVTTRASVDLGDPSSIDRVFNAVEPEVVVNAAAYTAVDAAEAEPERADAINHRAVARLAELAAARKCWLVHYSSDYVFDGHGSQFFGETHDTGPLNVYGRSKLAGDQAVMASGCQHLLVRTSWVHAPRGKNFVRTMLQLARERASLRVVADQHGAPTSAQLIADTTAALLDLALSGEASSGTYHLAPEGETTWHEIAQYVVAEATRLGAPLHLAAAAIEPIASADYPTPAIRPHNSRLDTHKLGATLGVTLPTWRQGVRQTVAALVAA